MDDADLHAALLEAYGGFEPKQAPADLHRPPARLGGEQHGVDVVEVAVGEHAGKLRARNRNDDRRGAGGDDELVVRLDDAVLGGHRPRLAIDGDDAVAL
jgi:hypothetical protein